MAVGVGRVSTLPAAEGTEEARAAACGHSPGQGLPRGPGTGERYVGKLYMGHRHGKGIYYWPDGSKFTGALYLGRVEGYGTLEWKDGRKFQGLYKSDERFGPGIESYPDGCQDVGLWLRDHLIKLCTEVPGYFSVLDYPAHYGYIDDRSQEYVSLEEDPFLRSYKHLPFDDKDILPEGVFAYSLNMDHLTLTHSFLEECDAWYFRNTSKLPEEDPWPVANVTSLLVRMQMHVYKHRCCQVEFASDVNLILSGARNAYGPPGPRELASEQLIKKAARGDYDGVYAILRNGLAHPDIADKHGYTALAAAAVHSHNAVVNLLLDSGADVNKCSDEGLSALSMCFILIYPEESFKGNIAERSLHSYKWTEKSESSETVSDAEGIISERQKRWETIQLLLRRGADPNASWAPPHLLFFAVKAADAEAVELLLKRGARSDVRLPSKLGGLTPLHIAASIPGQEGVQITQYLLHSAPDLNARAEDGNEIYGPDKIPQPQDGEANLKGGVTLQLKNEAGPPREYFSSYRGPVPEEGGRSALHIACEREDNSEHARDVIRLLLMHQANPNTLWSGHSPLSLAIASGNDLAVIELLKHGADPNLPLSGAVRSALCAAVSTAYEQQRTAAQRIALVDKLLEAGADILAPVTLQEGQRKAVGTVVDYAYYEYYQDRIAHTPYHILSASEQEVFQTRQSLLEHITAKLRERVVLKEKEWDQEELRRSKKLDSAVHTRVSKKKGGSHHVEEMRLPFFKYCYQCGRSVGVQLSPCQRCHEVFTCSDICKKKSWNERHRQECLGLLEKSTARAALDGSRAGCQKNVTGKKGENGRERKDEERGGRKSKAGTGEREHHKE
ncbi:ankyrin repeat and MYND domain-containing protein 1-like isoform X2 [Strigops habroptila]|uniref:ankyrin repeat and MYND domain-containing protein 1-like isoform X2 n=1 Tax=Strigops habroptila TaxID=2489341 RepID=UPI0011CF576B|nr:ankyrin repeat and MYND domain-containing protein 1-like isoform X2 [Strigops habroptila]